MKLTLVFTGKTEEKYLREGIDIYTKRLRHYIPHEIKIIGLGKKRSGHPAGKSDAGEIEKLVSFTGSNTFVVLLDENGDRLSSPELARLISKTMNHGYKDMVFITGGSHGIPEETNRLANRVVSLSDLTFPHQMVRLILVEQIYRAMTIIKGEPYHHQ